MSPVMRAPNGWPGLVGIALLLGGLPLLHGGRVGPASGPGTDMSGGYLQEFMNADAAGPSIPLPPGVAEAARQELEAVFAAMDEASFERRGVTVVGIFPTDAAAASAAAALDVPADAAAVTLGRLVLVAGLVSDPEDRPDPTVAALRGSGGDVLVEGDRFGEGTVVVDVGCTAATADAAATLATDLGDYASMLSYAFARPPWIGPPLTDDEALARSTSRRWMQGYAARLANAPWLAEYGQRIAGAGSDAERAALLAELESRVRELAPDALGDDAHPGVAALIAGQPTGRDLETTYAWGRAMGRLAGPVPAADPEAGPTWYEQRHLAQIGGVRSSERNVELGWTTFNRIALGLPALLDHLERAGCGDLRVALTDFDEVRGD
jgi:hypothetical protein